MPLLNLLPPNIWIAAIALLVGLISGWEINGWRLSADVSKQISHTAEMRLAAETAAERAAVLNQSRIDVIEGEFAASDVIRDSANRSIAKRVDINVQNTLPMLPSGFRLQHDSAARGVLPEAVGAGALDATAVAPRDVATVVTENYSIARETAAQLAELQAIVRASACFTLESTK